MTVGASTQTSGSTRRRASAYFRGEDATPGVRQDLQAAGAQALVQPGRAFDGSDPGGFPDDDSPASRRREAFVAEAEDRPFRRADQGRFHSLIPIDLRHARPGVAKDGIVRKQTRDEIGEPRGIRAAPEWLRAAARSAGTGRRP